MTKRKPKPKTDRTNWARQAKRQQELDEKARSLGFTSHTAMLTAILNGTAIVVRVEQYDIIRITREGETK